MSWSTWDVNGYGFGDDDIKTTLNKTTLDHFMEKAPKAKELADDFLGYFEPEDIDERAYEEFEDDAGKSGELALLCMIINEAENLSLEYHQGENGNFILFPPMYPWDAKTEREENICQEELDSIFFKYAGCKGRYVSAQYQG